MEIENLKMFYIVRKDKRVLRRIIDNIYVHKNSVPITLLWIISVVIAWSSKIILLLFIARLCEVT